MSRIDDLVAKQCPDGVEFFRLGDLLDYEQPGKYLVGSTSYDNEYSTPVLTAGQTFILGYTDESEGVYPASSDNPVVIFDDFTTAFKWVDFSFKVKSSAMKMLTPRGDISIDLRFIFYAMQCLHYTPSDHSRQWISTFSNFKIPLPPLVIQREVVAILDRFTSVTGHLKKCLSAERVLRSHQHSFFREFVLASAHSAPTTRIRDVADFFNAKAHEKLVDPMGTVALMTARFVSRGEANRFLRPEDVMTPAYKDDVALVMSDLPNGKALAKTFHVDADDTYAANQRVCLLRSRDSGQLLPRFLHHVMNRNSQLLAYNNGMDQTHLKKDQILDVRIPIPPMETQEWVVETLDALDSRTKQITGELEAEIAVRRQQFEYYRDQLLAFPERPNAA